ncbi:hypothetical protein SAMN05444682_107240 [Parapedobacter indicus]|uniref:Uncharacterized protein n=1 Tax=Parapedobacter indicus TaxID=1477437 RepID=A0A1I3NKV7_9SPHI|nr:hypothetical protein CLV26_107240 [Parapedobacter indicus]SFJ09974.1 hypothetical protein SAMN05444682_107240 [Parapedobacter indicus]
MTTNPMKEKLPLNEQDIKKLWKHLLPTVLFPFVAAGMFYAFFSFLGNDADTGFLQDGVSRYILVGFSVLFFGVVAYMIWSYAIDLRRGFKYRIGGKITDKKLNVRTSTTHPSHGKTGSVSSSGSTSRHYYVAIDGVQYSIEQEHYGKLKVGAAITMEKAPKSHVTLFLEVGNANELPPEKSTEADDEKRKFLSSTPRKVYFTQDDFEALKRGFWGKAKFRLIVISAMAFFIVPFMVGDMQIMLVFLFPLMLIAVYQFWKFNKEWRLYYRNKQYAYKEGIFAIVQDKSKYSHNGKRSNNVETSAGTIKVNDQLYGKLNVGDQIILYKPANGNLVLSVTNAGNEEIYVA